MQSKQDSLSCRGLNLPRRALRRLDEVGIFAQPRVSLEHQHLAMRYVVRGIESGGAVREIGRYITFCGLSGEPLLYLHPVDAIGVNGVHAVVVAPALARIELFRTGRTCQLLITSHQPGQIEDRRRPPLKNDVIFRGMNGLFDAEPRGDDEPLCSSILPQFWTRGGEKHEIPSQFVAGVQAATKGASCIGCSHMHFLVVPSTARLDAGGVG